MSNEESDPKHGRGTGLVPRRDSPGIYSLETIDIARLHAILSDPDRLKAIGESIVKALITDVLRSKLGFDGASPLTATWMRIDEWQRTTSWSRVVVQDVPSATARAVHDVLVEVSLSPDELQIVQQLGLRLHK
jgi:hypothetical protein